MSQKIKKKQKENCEYNQIQLDHNLKFNQMCFPIQVMMKNFKEQEKEH